MPKKTFFDETLKLEFPCTQAGLVLSLLLKYDKVPLPMFRENWIFHYNAVIMNLRRLGADITEDEEERHNAIGMRIRYTWRVLENKEWVTDKVRSGVFFNAKDIYDVHNVAVVNSSEGSAESSV